jgi:hypothetical protein
MNTKTAISFPKPGPYNRMQIKERREDVLVLLNKGMKGYEIAKELGVDASTVSRDIQYLISQSHNYLNALVKEALPFMYQTSIQLGLEQEQEDIQRWHSDYIKLMEYTKNPKYISHCADAEAQRIF